MSGAFFVETVTWVRHWTDSLFSFRTTRDRAFRFQSGQFVMVGLVKEDGRPLVRAYSIASPCWHDELEFYSIKAPGGPLPPLDPSVDRVMLCGGPAVLTDLKHQLVARGYTEGSIAHPGDFVLEKAFVEA